MLAKLKKAVSDAANRLDAAQQQTASRVTDAAARLDVATQQTASKVADKVADKVPQRLRRSSQPTLPAAAKSTNPGGDAGDRVKTSAAGDLIVHYQAHWRAIHAHTLAQAKERTRVDALVHKAAFVAHRRALTIDAFRSALPLVAADAMPALDALAADVAALCARVAALAAVVEHAAREQAAHTAFARASEHDLKMFQQDPPAAKRPAAPAPAAVAAVSIDDDVAVPVSSTEQSLLESFLDEPDAAPPAAVAAEQAWSDEDEPAAAQGKDDDDDDGYFGDQV